eukprot:4184357-Pyramimonas_sp.AAC.1
MTPQELNDLNILPQVPAMIATPTQWTCACGEGRVLDDFVVSKHFKSLIMDVSRIEGLSIATHWGVRLSLRVGP